MPSIPLCKRALVVTLFQRGESLHKISASLKVSRCAIRNILKKYRNGYGIANLSKTCTPCKLTQREKKSLVIQSKKNRFLTANQLRRLCDVEDKVSVSTVKRVLRSAQLFGRVAVKKPLLTTAMRKKRMAWCIERKLWNLTDWSKIIFTDESKIELFPRRRQYVRRGQGEELMPITTVKTKKFSPYVMIWGGIRADGKRFLKRVVGPVDSIAYQAVLDEALPALYSPRYLWQQDGATCHTSASTMNYLQHKAIRVVKDWPAQSADLSPIENLWNDLKEKVMNRKPANIEDIWRFAEEEFYLLPSSYISNLYSSMPCRVKAVVRAKGGNTDY